MSIKLTELFYDNKINRIFMTRKLTEFSMSLF